MTNKSYFSLYRNNNQQQHLGYIVDAPSPCPSISQNGCVWRSTFQALLGRRRSAGLSPSLPPSPSPSLPTFQALLGRRRSAGLSPSLPLPLPPSLPSRPCWADAGRPVFLPPSSSPSLPLTSSLPSRPCWADAGRQVFLPPSLSLSLPPYLPGPAGQTQVGRFFSLPPSLSLPTFQALLGRRRSAGRSRTTCLAICRKMGLQARLRTARRFTVICGP